MAGYKETPRQKMIAMMYLVLTALLALNVSKQILDAFLIVNESIETTNQSLKGSIDKAYGEFNKQLSLQKEKVQKWHDKAMEVQKLSDDMVAYIENVKAEVIARTDRITIEEARVIEVRNIKRKDNYDVPTVYFITPEAEGGAEAATKLKNELGRYRSAVLELASEKNRAALSDAIGLTTDGDYRNRDNKPESWEMHNFYHTILTADITILNKLIAEVRNAESKIVADLYQNITGEDFTFDKVTAEIIPNSNYVLQGGEFEARVFLAARDSKNKLQVEIGGQEFEGDTGVYVLKRSASGIGEQQIQGKIKVRNMGTGIVSEYPFNTSYIVAPPSATVSATKMNVFYRNLENPVSISVPGVARDKIRVSMTGGSIRPGGESGYIVTVGEGTEAYITVFAEIDGQSRQMGQFKYRIKRLPTPVAKVAGQTTGSVSVARLREGFVTAELENFLFEGIRYDVVSFTFSAKDPSGLLKEERVTGNTLNAGAKNLLSRLRPGSKVYFEDIRAKGPSGTETLQPIILRLR